MEIADFVIDLGIFVVLIEASIESIELLNNGKWKPWAAGIMGVVLSLVFGMGVLSYIDVPAVIGDSWFTIINALFTGIILVRYSGFVNIIGKKLQY